MAWIESHQSLGQHPKLLRLATSLNIHRAQAIGHLHCLWWWSLDYAPSGDLGSLADGEIALAAYWEGIPGSLVEALKLCGWIDPDGKLHDWAHYAGPCLMAKERQKKYREKRIALRNGDVTNTVTATTTLPNLTKPNLTLPNQTKPKKDIVRFQRPTPEEVSEYAKTIGYSLDGERFCSHYDSNGWMIGKSPMKNWKAAVVTWKKKQQGGADGKTQSGVGITGGFKQTKQPLF